MDNISLNTIVIEEENFELIEIPQNDFIINNNNNNIIDSNSIFSCKTIINKKEQTQYYSFTTIISTIAFITSIVFIQISINSLILQ